MHLKLLLKLRSDTTFGSGEGVPGLVDVEVEHDANGLPFLGGRSLKGLLVEECANVLYSLEIQGRTDVGERWMSAAAYLFGQPGSTDDDMASAEVGPAQLPEQLREAVAADVQRGDLTPDEVISSLTTIRRQTAVDARSGAPEEGSLRSKRVILHGTAFQADLDLAGGEAGLVKDAKALLAACVMGLQRVGLNRNRGLGHVEAVLLVGGTDVTNDWYSSLGLALSGEGASA